MTRKTVSKVAGSWLAVSSFMEFKKKKKKSNQIKSNQTNHHPVPLTFPKDEQGQEHISAAAPGEFKFEFEFEPSARAKIPAMTDDAGLGDDAERIPNRRKTSDMVTTMEMKMRTMMIQVWSVVC